MRNSVTRTSSQSGYTLIELSMILMIIGVLATPAIALYNQNRAKQDWDKTEDHIAMVTDALGSFRTAYGRYPCPTPSTAAPGDANYGLPDCAGATSVASNKAGGGNILIGTVPFKQLNLQEPEIHDGYGRRLLYAVTENLTASATFTVNGGGVSIVDLADTSKSLIDPADSSHFVVLSHGYNGFGAYSASGISLANCNTGTATEQENCNDDATFVAGGISAGFDDYVWYYTAFELSEWEIQTTDPLNIHLKNTNDIAVGVLPSTSLNTTAITSVRSVDSNSGGITVNNGRVLSSNICRYDETTTDCFPSSLIAGTHARGTALLCPNGEFLIGIADGEAQCANEVTVSCPSGQYVAGLDADKRMICAGQPQPSCPEQQVTAYCGNTRTIPNREHDSYHLVYSGACHRFPNSHNGAFFEAGVAGKTEAEIEAWIAELNNLDRTESACGNSRGTAQVRETYYCNSGTWEQPASQERWRSTGTRFSGDVFYTGNPPEQTIPYDKNVDLWNTTSNHDCWCREDYWVEFGTCDAGYVGTRPSIWRLRCPQTAPDGSSEWQRVYEGEGTCLCAPGQLPEAQSCIDYYNNQNGTSYHYSHLSGDVSLIYEYTCVNNVSTRVEPPLSVDTSSCQCPSYDPIINRDYCPAGTTNDFTWNLNGTTYQETGVASITTQTWVCPSANGGMQAPGDWSAVTSVSVPACTCDSTYYEIVKRPCPAGEEGQGIYYRRYMNCATGQLETDETKWVLDQDTCNACKYQAGNPSGDSEYKLIDEEYKVGSKCACGSDTVEACWDYGGTTPGKPHKIWKHCSCIVDVKN